MLQYSSMCGIFAYTGKQQALPILLDGLTCLEYRGYDSAGIYIPESGVVKSVGAVDNLKKKIVLPMPGNIGIAHLRWATHGEPTEENAHPHSDSSETIWIVHNGIIENYKELKEMLLTKGCTFYSSTDTEVLAKLIGYYMEEKKDFEKSVLAALNDTKGTYGMVASYKNEPNKIIAARQGAPVVIGLGNGENFVASDVSPILRHTKDVIYLLDGDVAVLTPNNHTIYNLQNISIDRKTEIIEWDIEEAKKGEYAHFMLKEIMEGAEVVENTIRGRLIVDEGIAKLGGLDAVAEQIRTKKRIIIVGCGTAYYAGLVAEYMIEEFVGMPVEVEVGSEFRYRKPIIDH